MTLASIPQSNRIKANIMLRELRQKLVGQVSRQAQEINSVEVQPETAVHQGRHQ